jgi:DNA (cytosine-5)-methyltransferase 1
MTIRMGHSQERGKNDNHTLHLPEGSAKVERELATASTNGKPIRCVDLFCGAGGSSCGARAAGVAPVAGIDMWPLAIETYQSNNPNAKTYLQSLERLDPNDLARDVGPVHIMLASPECTNHSVAKGNGERDENSRRTAFQVIRFAEVLQPRWLVVENVPKMRQWSEYGMWVRQLKNIGYKTPLEDVLDSQDYGVAQSRKRLFVICDREGDVSLPPKHRGPKLTVNSILKTISPDGNAWVFRPMRGRGLAKATWTRAHRAMRELGHDKEFLLVYYGTDGAGGWQSLDRPLRTITTLDRFALVRPNCRGHEMRMLQPPELAAAMGFPGDYIWPETARRNKIKLIGNAVCPPVMQAIVSHLIGK